MTIRTLSIAVILAASPLRAQVAPGASCRVTSEPSRRIELPDGKAVSVDVQSLVSRGDTLMAVGRFVYVFPAGANPMTPPLMMDSIIGFTIAEGKAAVVHAPLGTRTVFPKVAAGHDGFHVVFATSHDTAVKSLTQDTATIWYARFTRGAWSTPERVSSVSRVKLNQESTSAFLEWRGTLAFAFTFVDTMDEEGGGGVVLLRRRSGAWSADTLRTVAKPTSVRLAFGTPDSLLNALVVLRDTRSGASQVMVASFNTNWHAGRVLATTSRGVMMPSFAVLGDGYIASWMSWQFLDARTSTIEWARIARDGSVTTGPRVATGANTFPFEMIVRENSIPIWFYHGTPYGAAIAIASATDSASLRLGEVVAPFENPKVTSIPIDRTRILAFTMKQGKAPDEPIVSSYSTVLEFRCPRSAQR
jgi:hypothetical protein